MPRSVNKLIDSLAEDNRRRKELPFSPDFLEISRALVNPYARQAEIEELLSFWVEKHQPCLFGVASARKNLHYCILTDDDLRKTDGHIEDKNCR